MADTYSDTTMVVTTSDTVIVGGGIAGLACAKCLQDAGEDFLLISPDIGGRMLTSDDGMVNYGAFFVCADYAHVLPFVTVRSRIHLRDFCFHEHDVVFGWYNLRLLAYVSQLMRIRRILVRFRNALHAFRNGATVRSQKKVIEDDPWLFALYRKNAVDLVQELHLQRVTETYLSKGLYATTFSPVSDMNAFSFLQFLQPLITPIYTFSFDKEKIIASYQDKIVRDAVSGIHYKNGYYRIMFSGQSVRAKNLVLATEIRWSQHIAGVSQVNKPVSTHMLHIKGKPLGGIARKNYHVFSSTSPVQAVADLHDGTYLVYYKDTQPPLEQFFHASEIIAHHYWDPAGRINGHTLIDCDRGNNMYLIGDYNVAGLEDAYITGVYAANRIMQS